MTTFTIKCRPNYFDMESWLHMVRKVSRMWKLANRKPGFLQTEIQLGNSRQEKLVEMAGCQDVEKNIWFDQQN